MFSLRRSHLLELVLADPAHGAGPVLGKVLERDAVIACRIVDISAYLADVFLHAWSPFLFLILPKALAVWRKSAIFAAGKQKTNKIMTTFALNNLWTYLQGLSLSQSEREWLANKLVMPKETKAEPSSDDSMAQFLSLEGSWSETEEGEEYYQMMKHRNDDRPANRDINLDD